MSEPQALPPPEGTEPGDSSPPVPPVPPPEPPSRPARERNLVPWLYALGFVVLALALVWIWQNPTPGQQQPAPDLSPLQQQVAGLQAKVAALEQRPAPQPPNLAPLEQRVAALEQRPAPAVSAPPDLTPIEQQIAALKAQAVKPAPAPDLGPLERRLDAVDKQTGQLPGQLHDLAAQQQALAQQAQALQSGLKDQQDALAAKLPALAQQAASASAAADKADRLVRVLTARFALAAGEPLGSIPDAPPALARFAQAKPPTEAGLRLAFPDAAKAALGASQPETEGKPFGERLWLRAQSLVTVRQGDRVIVGNPAAGILAEAQTRLDAGDLSGAVAAVSSLTGQPAQAMAGWLDQAKALLAARAALDAMAAQT
jgi:hypothetical protein